MYTFLISVVVTSTVLIFIYFMFVDKSGKRIYYVLITSLVLILFLIVLAHNHNMTQHTNKCECVKENIDTISYPILYIA